jgi:hypothetical protein
VGIQREAQAAGAILRALAPITISAEELDERLSVTEEALVDAGAGTR